MIGLGAERCVPLGEGGCCGGAMDSCSMGLLLTTSGDGGP
jgi:hypothetical protein